MTKNAKLPPLYDIQKNAKTIGKEIGKKIEANVFSKKEKAEMANDLEEIISLLTKLKSSVNARH
ncbi:MAG TPA: hypothetical protein ENJ95_14505 [Bacteroidetes bacterium]|nr:hypothetical protein [Bacteroidota bacterium]